MSKLSKINELLFTGERLVTSVSQEQAQIVYEHLHRYFFASQICKDLSVVDVASGEGYGSNILAQVASSVIGVDKDIKSIKHASKKYKRSNLKYIAADCVSMPIQSKTVDVVVSFETIEHIFEHQDFINEIKRILKPDGVLIISSPDKAEYSDRSGNKNTFHLGELYRNDFLNLLGKNFQNTKSFQQRLVGASYIAADVHNRDVAVTYGTFSGDFNGGTFNEGINEGLYILAVCSNSHIPNLKAGVFENRTVSAHIWDSYESINKIRDSYHLAKLKVSDLEKVVIELTVSKTKFEGDFYTKCSELVLLENKLINLEKQNSNQYDIYKFELNTLKEKLDISDKEIIARGEWGLKLAEEIKKQQDVITNYVSKLEELMSENQELSKKLSNEGALKLELESKKNELEQQIKENYNSLALVNTQMLSIEAIRSSLEQQLEPSQIQIIDIIKENNTRIDEITRGNSELSYDIQKCKEINNLLVNENNSYVNNIDSLEDQLRIVQLLVNQFLNNEDAKNEALIAEKNKNLKIEDNYKEVSLKVSKYISLYNQMIIDNKEMNIELNAKIAKIYRMQNSFSWKLTAPLRFLRRIIID